MASEYTYLLTQKAEADLDGIVSYLSLELANAKAASDFVGKLQDVIGNAAVPVERFSGQQ